MSQRDVVHHRQAMRLAYKTLLTVVLAGTAGAQHPVSGQVTGPDGKPVAAMVLRFQQETTIVDCFGDTEGRFTTPHPLAAGRWQMTAILGPPVVQPREILIRDGTVPEPLKVRVERLKDTGRITGRVQDEHGKPAAGAWILAGERSQQTDVYGEFQLERGIGRSPARFRLVVPNYGSKLHRVYPYRRLTAFPTWGQRAITLVLKTGIPAKLKVIDGDTGKPVPRYYYRLWGWPWGPSTQPGHYVANPEGVTALPGLDVGSTRLIVYPDVPGYLCSSPHVIQVREVPDQVFEVKLFRARPLTVRLIDPDGNPVEASTVQLWEAGDTQPSSPFQTAFGPKSRYVLERGLPIRLASGVTNASGEVVLTGRPTKTSLSVVAQGPGHVPKLVKVAGIQRDARELTVKVSGGAIVTGKLVGELASDANLLNMHVRGERGDLQVFEWRRVGISRLRRLGFPIFADGSFEIRNIPPGRWWLVPYGRVGGIQLNAMPLASLALVDGQNVDVELDTDKLRPARIEGKLMLGDTPLGEMNIRAEGFLPGQKYSCSYHSTRTTKTGEFCFEGLAPIKWRLYMSLVEEGRSASQYTRQVVCFTEDLSLKPGQKLSRTFKVVTRGVSVRILSPDGKVAVPYRYLEFEPDDAVTSMMIYRILARRFTNAAGVVTLSHAPLRRVRVYAWPTDWELRELDPAKIRQGKHRVLVGILDPRRLKEGQQVSLRLSPEH